MANFAQRKIARESIEGTGTVVPDGLELPAESVEGILAELAQDEKEIDQHDAEGDVLAEDVTETEEQFDAVGEADAAANGEGGDDAMDAEEDMPDEAAAALDVAQESIRRRWGFDHRVSVARESYGSRNRRKVARESLWDDIKAFFKRIWEWLKEQGRKVKDRWLKFSNQGKSIQKRSKQYGELIKKLGKVKTGKEEIKGGFIKALSIGGKFIGDNVTELKNTVELASEAQKVQAGFLEDMTKVADNVERSIADSAGHQAAAGSAALFEHTGLVKDLHDMAGEEEILGNMVGKVEVSGEGEDISVSASAVESERDVASEVKTPTTAVLTAVNGYYNQLGKDIEKFVQAYQKNNQLREKYEKGLEKIIKRLDNIKVEGMDPDLSKLIRVTRRFITATQSAMSAAERQTATITKNAIAGINGYLQAGIAAYEKK